MKRKLICWVLCISMISSVALLSGCGSKSKSSSAVSSETTEPSVEPSEEEPKEAVISESALPAGYQWQYDCSFPDWQDRSSYAANNRLGFTSYSGQGEVYVTPEPGTKSFTLYINDQKIDTSKMVAGKTYKIDISGITRNGTNSLQISGLSEGSVSVRIPYPVLTTGTPEEVGINPKSIELIDKIISADVEHGFPSAQIAVIRHGKLVYENQWGNVKTYDENGNPVEASPVTKDTLYDLASVTKMFSVNYALQYLVSKGELDIDAKVSDILGSGFYEDTKYIKYTDSEEISLERNKQLKKNLTIRNLLMHQGGFPEGPQYFNDRYDHSTRSFDSDSGNDLYVGTGANNETRDLTLKIIFKTPLMYTPGTRTLYSDLDYMILCYVVEEVTGQRLDEFLKETFWEPMGLTHMTYNPLQNGFTKDDCAATELMGNTRDGNVDYTGVRKGTVQGEVHDPNAFYCMAGVSGHAGLFSNATDLAKLSYVMMSGGYGDKKYFSKDVIDIFTSVHDVDSPGYALGWWREGEHTRDYYFGSVTDSNTYGHQGFTGTFAMIDPDHDLVVVLLTNKIHSRILKGDPTLNTYEGNLYTTSYMGFIPEILEIGMDGEKVDDSIWKSLVSDMAEDYKRNNEAKGITDKEHPRWKAYDALMAVDI